MNLVPLLCHPYPLPQLCQIYPSYVTEGLRQALEAFDKRMPGFITDQALLHGVETRTSAPVQVDNTHRSTDCRT